MHTTPEAWGWRWARLALFGLLLAGWECPGNDSDDDDDDGNSSDLIQLPFAFEDHPFAYSLEFYPPEAGDWVFVEDEDNPDWLTITHDELSILRFYGTPPATGRMQVTVRFDDSEGNSVYYGDILEILPTNSRSIAGQWTLTVDVFQASGVCADDVDDVPSTHTVSLSQVGSDVSVSGIQGESANILHGYLFPSIWASSLGRLELHGSVPEDGGETDIQYTLELNSLTAMHGTEQWFWDGPWEDCDGESNLLMTKVP